mgnify:CR=1 FL=1
MSSCCLCTSSFAVDVLDVRARRTLRYLQIARDDGQRSSVGQQHDDLAFAGASGRTSCATAAQRDSRRPETSASADFSALSGRGLSGSLSLRPERIVPESCVITPSGSTMNATITRHSVANMATAVI